MVLRSSFAALTLAAFLLPTPALAAGPAAPSAADRATARALAAEAHKAFDAKDYAAAADRFARADALVHAPTLMLGLARSQAALGKYVAANESLNQILREGLAPNAPKVWADAVDAARQEVTTITPKLGWVTVTLRGVTPEHEDEVTLLIDGVEVNRAAIGVPRAVDPGKHAVIAKVMWGKGAEKSVTLGEGTKESVVLEVKIDPPPPGVVKPKVIQGPQGPQFLVVTTPPPPPWRRPLGFALLGVGGAFIVVGAATGGAVLGMHKSLVSACPGGRCPASEQSKLTTYNALGVVSTAGFVAGPVIAAVGGIVVATTPKQPATKAPAPQVGLAVLPTYGGGELSAVGSF